MAKEQKLENLRQANASTAEAQRERRLLVRNFVERNYGVPFTKADLIRYVNAHGFGVSPPTLERDFAAMGIEQVTAVVAGKKITFYAQVGYVPEESPEYLRRSLSPEVIENEVFKEMLRSAMDVFVDGKRVVITTAYEKARHLAMWIKNLWYPEIWYLSKEDGSVIIIETRSEARAKFLRRRLWSVGSENQKLREKVEAAGEEGNGSDGEVV